MKSIILLILLALLGLRGIAQNIILEPPLSDSIINELEQARLDRIQCAIEDSLNKAEIAFKDSINEIEKRKSFGFSTVLYSRTTELDVCEAKRQSQYFQFEGIKKQRNFLYLVCVFLGTVIILK